MYDNDTWAFIWLTELQNMIHKCVAINLQASWYEYVIGIYLPFATNDKVRTWKTINNKNLQQSVFKHYRVSFI